MISLKKIFLIFGLLLPVLAIALCANFYIPSVSTVSKTYAKPQIILDAGHGGLFNTIKLA